MLIIFVFQYLWYKCCHHTLNTKNASIGIFLEYTLKWEVVLDGVLGKISTNYIYMHKKKELG